MTARAFARAARAQGALKLNEDLLWETSSDDKIEQLGAHYAAGRLQEALRESSRVIEELIAELAGRAA